MSDKCIRCGSTRLAEVVAKCSDCCSVRYMGSTTSDGYVPNSEIGAGDYIQFSYCMGCGQIQGAFPEGEPDWWIQNKEKEDGLADCS